MPLCTTCTRYIPYLYTVYESAFNLRLEQCVRIKIPAKKRILTIAQTCGAFADPYVEHDSLLLLIDLILLKRGVYRHLLFNRGAEPRRIADDDKGQRPERPSRWPAVLPLGGALTAVDACMSFVGSVYAILTGYSHTLVLSSFVMFIVVGYDSALTPTH